MKMPKDMIIDYFKKLSSIPRPSGNEELVRDYIVKWANENGYKVEVDKIGNVIVDCSAKDGYENKEKVILQAHMDMVCVADEELDYEPTKDAIKVVEDGDYLHSEGTSLGADNGMGMAIMQYLADQVTMRGQLKLIFTVDEEETTIGAMELDSKELDAKYLINLDSDVSDKVMISSAGSVVVSGNQGNVKEKSSINDGFAIKIRGLAGGHSGDDINKNRTNAIVLGAEILKEMSTKGIVWELSSFEGGTASNGIPSSVDILGNSTEIEQIEEIVRNAEIKVKDGSVDDNQVKITATKTAQNEWIINKEEIINYVLSIPNGVIAMSKGVDGLVGTSSNIGILTVNKDVLEYAILARAEIGSDLVDVANQIKEIATSNNIQCEFGDFAPSWPADQDSQLLGKLQEAYKRVTGEFLEPIAVHAGLECAEFRAKNKDIELVSISPDVEHGHSTRERVYIPSIQKIAEVLECLLKEI
ncbi:MAG: beta-Ala-His dipeptidase [Anaerovoracaceae bacterium]